MKFSKHIYSNNMHFTKSSYWNRIRILIIENFQKKI